MDQTADAESFRLLFVCTGNTCRSPMAEAICKAMIADRLGCPPEELEHHGFWVLSAGVSAMDGLPAASNAIQVVRELGGGLESHASRRVTLDLLDQADLIVAMTQGHRDALIHTVPEVAAKVRLLDASGGDIEDPIG